MQAVHLQPIRTRPVQTKRPKFQIPFGFHAVEILHFPLRRLHGGETVPEIKIALQAALQANIRPNTGKLLQIGNIQGQIPLIKHFRRLKIMQGESSGKLSRGKSRLQFFQIQTAMGPSLTASVPESPLQMQVLRLDARLPMHCHALRIIETSRKRQRALRIIAFDFHLEGNVSLETVGIEHFPTLGWQKGKRMVHLHGTASEVEFQIGRLLAVTDKPPGSELGILNADKPFVKHEFL